MTARRNFPTAALLAAIVLIVGACDGQESTRARGPEATASANPSSSGESPTDNPSETASPGASASAPVFSESDEVLRVAIREPRTLDPMLLGDPGSTLIARQLYEGLTKWNPVSDKVEPAAARSWKVKKGGALYEFTLRDGMTFHDGTPVTAADFKFAFDRIAKRKNASELAYVLARIEGFKDVNQTGDVDHLSGVRAPTDSKLVIELTEPDQDFPIVLTHPALVPLPAEAVKDLAGFLARPVGNGSFQMASDWQVGEEVQLRDFAEAIDPPSIDGIRFVPYPEAAASYLDFLDDQLDVAEVPVGQVEGAAEEFGRRGYKALLNSYNYGFNLRGKVLASRKARVAINRAIDRDAIAKVVYKEVLVPARGILPPSMPGFGEDACKKMCDYSEKAARKLLKGVKGRSISVDYPDQKPHPEVAEAVAKNLKSVGFKVKLNEYKLKDFAELLQQGSEDMYRLTWLAEYPSPDAYLSALFETGSPDNDSNYSSKKVDALLKKARAERDRAKRIELYQKAERLILADGAIAPIGYFETHWAAQPRVQGISFDETGGFDAAPITFVGS